MAKTKEAQSGITALAVGVKDRFEAEKLSNETRSIALGQASRESKS